MNISFANDGDKYTERSVLDLNIKFNNDRDFRKNLIWDNEGNDYTGEYEYIYDYVGFQTNEENDLFIVFPKSYLVKDIYNDAVQLFNLITRHTQKRPDLYIGKEYGKRMQTNYPFAAFFGIYDYYEKYGLYFEDKILIKPNVGKTINWKETIHKSNKYLSQNRVNFFPLYYEQSHYFSTFLTECMVFAIDYTIYKFRIFIDLEETNSDFPDDDFFNKRKIVLEKLILLRQFTFNETIIQLIDHLIHFYSELHEGGNYYLKHYAFYSIWEDIVLNYLKSNFKRVNNNQLEFGTRNTKEINFLKPTFYPNLANNKHSFSPDYYYEDGNTQLIFDAKYRTDIKGMDYKQIAYILFLKDYSEQSNQKPKYSQTYSALLLPSHKRSNMIHFKMDPLYSALNKDIIISEEYLDIREVIDAYL